jgi:cell cycle arrest protein BUB3
LWNIKDTSNVQFVTKFDLPGKVYSMDITPDGKKLVVGTSTHQVLIYDTKQNQILQKRTSSLKFQIRCIKCFIDNSGFAISSTEGRVAMEYFDTSKEAQSKKYSFKCHRNKDESGLEIIYPVNAIAFHPTFVIYFHEIDFSVMEHLPQGGVMVS